VYTDRFVTAALQFLNKADVLPPGDVAHALGILKAVLIGVTSVLGAFMLLLGIIFKKQQLAKKAAASPAGEQHTQNSLLRLCQPVRSNTLHSSSQLGTCSVLAAATHVACAAELQVCVCRRLSLLMQIGRMAARVMPPWGCQPPWRCCCGWWQPALWVCCVPPLLPQGHLLLGNWQLGTRSRE
jgi:hypothetical protein